MEPSLLTLLQRSQLTNGQSPSDLITLVRQLQVTSLSAGEHLFSSGDPADVAYLLTLGHLQVRTRDGALLSTEQAGALVGEQALMPGSSGMRNATIIAETDCRLLVVDRSAFDTLLSRRRDSLESLSDARTRSRLSQQSASLRALLSSSQEHRWDDGALVFREGDPADGLYMVLSGQAQVVTRQDGEPVHIATVYPGQCFGEIGVLQEAKRSASIIAHSQLRAAFVPAEQVRELSKAHPDLESFLHSLLRSRALPRRGLGHQHVVIQEGQACIQTVFALNDGRELIGLRTPGGHYTLSQPGRTVAETIHISPTTMVTLDTEGCIVGFSDQGGHEDVGGLQELALGGSPLSRQQKRILSRAAKAAASRAPDAVICRCLSIDRQTLTACISSGARSMAALSEATGCGTGCGGCIRQITPMLSGVTSAPPVERLGGPKQSPGFLGWLRSILR
jgi:CRP-like cAMP-binding protein/bacterioferritin-associated ferredoxin